MMNEQEEQIKILYDGLENISDYFERNSLHENLLNQIIELDFNQIFSPEFTGWVRNLDLATSTLSEHVELWLDLNEYSQAANKDFHLQQIEKKLLEYIAENKLPSGKGLLPDVIADGILVRSVYLNGDKDLVALFEKLLPPPPSRLFPNDRIPKAIQERENNASLAVKNVINRNAHRMKKTTSAVLEQVESIAIKIQRSFRRKKRDKEMKILAAENMARLYDDLGDYDVIKNANTPYKPQCSAQFPGLADKLLNASKNIKPFTAIKHIAAKNAVASIMDDGLLGRKSLLNQYKAFRPAALYSSDQDRGDANVICFGAFNIDPQCLQDDTIEFTLNLDRLRSLSSEVKNPCIFFKQKDLGFTLNKTRTVAIGDIEISFTHTEKMRNDVSGKTRLQFLDKYGTLHHYGSALQFEMISSNFEEMNSILAMNFFRFLDNCISTRNSRRDEDFINKIYAEFAKLDDEKLDKTLLQLTQNMCDTMEFNFYGAFLMNPALIKEINLYEYSYSKPYQLKIPEFIASLQAGDLDQLNEIKNKIPQLFTSYRFIDYLLPQIQNQTIKDALLECRSKIVMPQWRKELENEQKSFHSNLETKNPDRLDQPKSSDSLNEKEKLLSRMQTPQENMAEHKDMPSSDAMPEKNTEALEVKTPRRRAASEIKFSQNPNIPKPSTRPRSNTEIGI